MLSIGERCVSGYCLCLLCCFPDDDDASSECCCASICTLGWLAASIATCVNPSGITTPYVINAFGWCTGCTSAACCCLACFLWLGKSDRDRRSRRGISNDGYTSTENLLPSHSVAVNPPSRSIPPTVVVRQPSAPKETTPLLVVAQQPTSSASSAIEREADKEEKNKSSQS